MQPPRDPRAAFVEKPTREYSTEHATAGRVSLFTGKALVDQDFNLDPTVLGPPALSLVRCRWPVFAHRARCYDMPHRHGALLEQISKQIPETLGMFVTFSAR